MSKEAVELLLVEDNPSDEELTLHVLKKNNLTNRIHVVRDGAEALEFLFGNGVRNMPKLILLDLKLPKVNGIEVLARIKGDDRTKIDRKSTRLNSSHRCISYAVFCL